MQTMHKSQNAKKQDFAKMQKGIKKDFNLPSFKNPCSVWQMDTIYKSMINYVIMHNMIIEDERDNSLEPFYKCWSIEAWIDFSNIFRKH